MGDNELILAVAELWVENGGDARGLDYCVSKIRETIERLSDDKES